MRWLLGVAAGLSCFMQGAEIKQDFPPVRMGDNVEFRMSVIWANEKKPENAKASLFISEGRFKDVFTFATVAELKNLHATLGKMIEACEGK